MKIRKVGIAKQDNCKHEFVPLGITEKKTFGGFYKEKKEEKQGEMFKLFICEKCSRIVSIDFHIGDSNPPRRIQKRVYSKRKKKIKCKVNIKFYTLSFFFYLFLVQYTDKGVIFINELRHVAIIVDGNGRWAKERGKTRSEGHLEGSKNLEKLIFHVADTTNIEYLSLYVFSTENFKRDKKEVDYLMNLFIKWFKKSKKIYKNKNIKILFSGRKEPLNDKVYNAMKELEKDTINNTGLVVNFCLNYGGRAEIIDACKTISKEVKDKLININDINEEYFSKKLYNPLPDVDYLIRTSGEQRISNFLLWELSYAEFIFVKDYFPDFNCNKFDEVISNYYKRNRRFGDVKEE